jgi:hypothetical protein
MNDIRESQIEERLRRGLEGKGFKVLKLVTPGNTGTPDRMILRPSWSPGPPWFIEIKRPGMHERRLQELVRDGWRARGALVLDMINTYSQVDALVVKLYTQCMEERL